MKKARHILKVGSETAYWNYNLYIKDSCVVKVDRQEIIHLYSRQSTCFTITGLENYAGYYSKSGLQIKESEDRKHDHVELYWTLESRAKIIYQLKPSTSKYFDVIGTIKVDF